MPLSLRSMILRTRLPCPGPSAALNRSVPASGDAPAMSAREATTVQSTADLIGFPAAAGFEAVASEAVH